MLYQIDARLIVELEAENETHAHEQFTRLMEHAPFEYRVESAAFRTIGERTIPLRRPTEEELQENAQREGFATAGTGNGRTQKRSTLTRVPNGK